MDGRCSLQEKIRHNKVRSSHPEEGGRNIVQDAVRIEGRYPGVKILGSPQPLIAYVGHKGKSIKATLIGTWQLRSWKISNQEGETISEPFGSNPQGVLVYTEADWMSAAICRDNRDLLPEHQSLRSAPPEALTAAYLTYFHYTGPYRVVGQDVIHSVAMSHNPNFVGSEQLRHFVFKGDQLTLSGEETINGKTRYHHLNWQRMANLSGGNA